MAQEPKSSLFTADPYYIPGYGGFCPQLRYQLGGTYGSTTSHLLTDPSVMKSPRSVLSPLRHVPTQPTAEPRQLQPSHVFPMDHKIVLPKIYIPPGYAGHRPMLQFQHATSFSRMVANAVDDFLEVQCSVTRGQINRPVEATYNHDAREDVFTTRHWKPKAECKSPLSTYVRNPKIDLPQNLQRNAIPGYTGFIPRYNWSTGVSFAPGVKESMDEFDRRQIQIQYPGTCSERRLKPTYWRRARIYSPAGLLPKYTGFVPGFRDTFGMTFGDSTRQLYVRRPL